MKENQAPLRPVTRVVGAGAGAGLVVIVVGALLGRADVAVLAVAPLLSIAWDLSRRVDGEPSTTVVPLGPGEAPVGTLAADVRVSAPKSAQAVLLRLWRVDGLVTDVLLRGGERRVRATLRSGRTGSVPLFGLDCRGIGSGAATITDVVVAPAPRVLVLPSARTMPGSAVALPPRLRGLSGAHNSRRPGDGGDLRDLHPFTAGDSLRRVDWRATARRSPQLTELYVRRTHALAEAVVSIVVDSRDDIGPDPLSWIGMRPVRADAVTSLDIAREAAATLARAYLDAGDRVGLDDLGVRRRPLPPGAGRRQLDRAVHRLAMMRPEDRPRALVRPPQVPSGALVVVISTFVDEEASRAARYWRRAGHRVIAVDVLPALELTSLDAKNRLAARMLTLERDDRLAELTAAGVELLRWDATVGVHRGFLMLARRSGRQPGQRALR